MTVIPAQPNDLVITMQYFEDDGGEVVEMWDHHVIGWYFGNSTNPNDAWPCIVSDIPGGVAMTKPDPPEPSGEVQSPPWIAVFCQGDTPVKAIATYGIWTGSPAAVFDYLATNNSANRRLKSNFVYPPVMVAFSQWRNANPNNVWRVSHAQTHAVR
jgi:hypothetical protein